MKSVVYTRLGPPSVLELVERPLPAPGPGEVRVRVAVSGVNPSDAKRRQAGIFNTAMPFPEVTPNQDGAGVVDAIGDGVHHLSVGQRVWVYMAVFGRPTGTAQQYTVIPAERAVPLPDVASFDVGASLGVPAMTAHRALTVHEDGPSRLGPGALDGKTVLVAGGAGAVGHAAIQLARWAGATVITTVSSLEKAALAAAAGAHHTVNYRFDGAAETIRGNAADGVDVVVEVGVVRNAELLSAVVADRAVVSVYANDGGTDASLPITPNWTAANVRFQFVLVYTMGQTALDAAAEDITAALTERVLEVGQDAGLPITRFALAHTPQAHAAVEDGVVGKILIEVDDAVA
ncbi:NADPH:quinone reductase [Mycolicibacterium sp. P9-64]|uniref:NADPH:quinone reductase n=1 Tax=Mycolicibacterium sp. P9-64 TaxID=2024612 RepID=UPI0011ED9687|nr:NADPH:quinone reductase [Mycolicibacterium sp. P9-64]KAA0085601.1 NADPH:quinone reductase [Mycolicibacterium sp. P9-64]